jgi:hypothetical protein
VRCAATALWVKTLTPPQAYAAFIGGFKNFVQAECFVGR